jgi:hypothetical protein
MYNKEDAKFVNTTTWVLLNHDTHGVAHRKSFLSEHGGSFVKVHQGYAWRDIPEEINVAAEPKTIYVIVDPEGKEIIPDNFQGFCRENNLNKSALYGVANGLRAHHKKYTCYRKEV